MRATNSFAPKREEGLAKKSLAESRMSRTSFGDFGGSDNLKKTKSIIYLILVFLGMAYVGITFIFSIMAYRNTSSKTWNINQIVNNWQLKPIVQIAKAGGDHCASGYEPMIGKFYIFTVS